MLSVVFFVSLETFEISKAWAGSEKGNVEENRTGWTSFCSTPSVREAQADSEPIADIDSFKYFADIDDFANTFTFTSWQHMKDTKADLGSGFKQCNQLMAQVSSQTGGSQT